MPDYFNAVKEKAAFYMNSETQSVAHRMDHVERVLSNAREIIGHYPEVDVDLLETAALLHDVCQPFDRKEEHVELSVNLAGKILQEVGYPLDRAEMVKRIISEHSTERLENRPSSLEAKILFDADKIDGVGASGIARFFSLLGQRGKTPPEAVAWYLNKARLAKDAMQTKEGCEMAAGRAAFVIEFIKRFQEENGTVWLNL